MFGRNKEEKATRRNAEEPSSYLRSRRPVRVRPGWLAWARRPLRQVLTILCLAAIALSAGYAVEAYLRSDARFVVAEEGLRLTGLQHVSSEQARAVFASDWGTSLSDILLEERRRTLSELDWAGEVSILRVWPNRLWVHIEERRPIAFLRMPQDRQNRIETMSLIDSDGVLLPPPAGAAFQLPVLTGLTASMPLAERRERLKLLERLLDALDDREPKYSPLLSEIDLSDPTNVRVTTVHGADVIQLQMGDDQFRHRYALFLKYVESWKSEFGKVRAVDLRFEGQVAVR